MDSPISKAAVLILGVAGAAVVADVSGPNEHPTRNAAVLYKQAFELHHAPGEAYSRAFDELLTKVTRGKTLDQRLQALGELEKLHQAVENRPDVGEGQVLRRELHEFLFKDGPETQRVKVYLDSNQSVVELTMQAAELAHCDWAVVESPPMDEQTRILQRSRRASEMKDLAILLFAHAKSRIEAGEIDGGLDEALLGYKLAEHLDPRPMLNYVVGTFFRRWTNRLVRQAISRHPMPVYQLVSLKNRLSRLDRQRVSFLESFDYETEMVAAGLARLTDQEIIAKADEPVASLKALEPNSVPDIEWVVHVRPETLYRNYCRSVRLAFTLPYSRACAEVERVCDRFKEKLPKITGNETAPITVDAGRFLALFAGPSTTTYKIDMSYRSDFNATQIGIQLLIAKVSAGRLPETLPANSPPDPFSGEPFDYERTDDGFVLRCRAKSPFKGKVDEYTFTLPRELRK